MPPATEITVASNPPDNPCGTTPGQDHLATMQPLLQPDTVIPSVEAPEATSSSQARSLMTRYQLSDAQHTIQRKTVSDRSSCPPQSLGLLRDRDAARKLKYLDSFSTDILPPPTAPLYLQIITYIQRWGIWAAVVSDENVRERLIQAMAEKMENVWLEGMRKGLIPETIPATDGSDTTRLLGAEINASLVRPRRKRQVDPSREVVIKSIAGKSSRYPITAGELREADVTMDMIIKRVLDGNLGEVEMMEDVLEQIEKESIDANDWYGVLPRTDYNTMGRDLKMYCLWETQKSTAQIDILTGLLKGFKIDAQLRNTQIKIDEQQEKRDLFLALALILHEKDEHSDSDDGTVRETHEEHKDLDAEEPVTHEIEDSEPIALTADDQGLQNEEISGGIYDVTMADAQSKEDAGKRPLEADEVALNQPTKKIKMSEGFILDEKFTVPDTTGRDFTPTSVPSLVLPDNHDPRLKHFIDSNIFPKLNRMLQQSGHQSIANGTDWTAAKVALRKAGIGREVRNQCAREIKKFCADLIEPENAEILSQPTLAEPETQQTFDGRPTPQEIVQSIPNEGLTPQEFHQIFKDRANPNDARWPELVKTVAYMDKAKQRWFALTTPVINEIAATKSRKSITEYFLPDPGASHNKASTPISKLPDPATTGGHIKPTIKLTVQPQSELKITLKTKPGFNPGDYSSRQVNNIRGFRWRYVASSSVAERDSMDTVIQTYVKDRIDFDREKEKVEGDLRSSMPDRFGTYEILSHPENKSQSIVHGIWDYRTNPKKVSAAQWFYDGKDGEWVYPVVSVVINSFGGEKRYLENANELEDQSTQAKPAQNAISKLDGTFNQDKDDGKKRQSCKKARSKGKTSKTSKEKLQGIPLAPPLPSEASMTKDKKRKVEETHDEARPKRRTARTSWTSYAEDNEDGDDDDDEYRPGSD